MAIEIRPRTIRNLAIESGIPESVLDQYDDQICALALKVTAVERKKCANTIRGMWHTNRPPLHDMLEAIDR